MISIRQITFFALFTLTSYSYGQQRIGVDVSSRMDNLMLFVHYQKVLKNRLLYSAGVYFGGNGRAFVTNDPLLLQTGHKVASPFPASNLPISDSTGNYSILDYNTTSRSVGIQFGLGYFFEFDVKHGIRTNVNCLAGFVNSRLSGFYRSSDNLLEKYSIQNHQHFIGAVSLEAYHTIRLTGRMTFNYGLKVPYYFTLDKGRFNPTQTKDLLNGFEPQLSIGLTRVIGKC